jgi:hypothetical protein
MPTRYRRHGASLACVVTAVVCAAPNMVAQQDKLVFVPVRASEVMSAADRHSIGVDRLTPEQLFALDVWLTKYSAELRASASPPPQRGIARTIFASADDDRSPAASDAEPAQRGGRRYRDRVWTPLLTVPPASRLAATPEDGGFVRLADGTLWEVYPPDRTSTDAWHAGDYITVSLASTAMGDFDHVLVDTNANTRAHVRFVDVVGRSRHR